MIDHLWSVSADRLRRLALAPPNHPVWSQDPYKRFVDSADEMRDAVKYVEENPEKSGLPRQFFSFVKPYQGEWSGRR